MKLSVWAALVGVACGCGGDDTNFGQRGRDALDKLLAATPAEGRLPGTNQAIAQLVADEFRAAGVKDVTIEDFSIPVSTATAHMVHKSGSSDAIAHEVNVFGGNGNVTGGTIVDVGAGGTVDPTLAGKVAMLDFSVSRSLRTQYRRIVESGAAAAVIDSKLDALRQRSVWTLVGASQIHGPIPVVTIDQTQAAALRTEIMQTGEAKIDLSSDSSVSTATAYNVIARIPGTKYPDRVMVVNAHLDSWFTGAADDGQSVAALIALAKSFADDPLPYTVELVAFDCEETFLLGSNNYILRRKETLQDTVVAAVSLEMLAPKSPALKAVTMDPRDVWQPLITDSGLVDNYSLTLTPIDLMTAFDGEVPSDQGNFWSFGFSGMFVVTTYDEYHTSLDTADNIDAERYDAIVKSLEKTLRGAGAISPDVLGKKPVTWLELTPTVNASANGIQGSVIVKSAGTPSSEPNVTVTVFDETYTSIIGSGKAVSDGSGMYTFNVAITAPGPMVISIDAVTSSKASGRSLIRM